MPNPTDWYDSPPPEHKTPPEPHKDNTVAGLPVCLFWFLLLLLPLPTLLFALLRALGKPPNLGLWYAGWIVLTIIAMVAVCTTGI